MAEPGVRSSRAAVASPDAPQPQVPNRRAALEAVADAQSARQRRSLLIGAVSGAVLLASVFAVVSMHVHMAQNQYGLRDMQVSLAQQQQRNLQLKDEFARKSSGEWIVPRANALGLQQPERVEVVTVEASPITKSPSGNISRTPSTGTVPPRSAKDSGAATH